MRRVLLSALILILLCSCGFTVGGFSGFDVPIQMAGTWTADGVRAEITYDNIVITYDEGPLVVDLGEMVWYDQDAYRITSDSYSFSITAIDGSYEHNYSFQLTQDGLEMTRYSSSGQEERITLIPD